MINNPFHILDVESFSKKSIKYIFDKAEKYSIADKNIHKKLLSNITIISLFYENSTRTLLSFEIAAKLI